MAAHTIQKGGSLSYQTQPTPPDHYVPSSEPEVHIAMSDLCPLHDKVSYGLQVRVQELEKSIKELDLDNGMLLFKFLQLRNVRSSVEAQLDYTAPLGAMPPPASPPRQQFAHPLQHHLPKPPSGPASQLMH